jgi:hypothetical protein
MLPTNQYFRTKLQVLDAQLRQLEQYGRDRIRASALEELREEREILNLILLNRRVEGAKPVVDLKRWRSANGALSMVTEQSEAKQALAG